MSKTRTCGEALMQLLEAYGVETVFGIPGDHNLELYRGIAGTNINHILARNEQGAGFMADGYGRATGRPGVCTIISGPGVTNAATAIGQAYADSIPMLIVSSANCTPSLGKGWGCLHETTDQRAITAPLTAFSAMAYLPQELPELVAQAFAVFYSDRPRPVHISIPFDVLEMPVEDHWSVCATPSRAVPAPEALETAATMLAGAARPVMVVGGGASMAGEDVEKLAVLLNAGVIASNAGKGVVPDSNPLSLSGSFISAAVRDYLGSADVILSIGCELADSDSFVDRMPINGKLIRVDIDASKFNDQYPADLAVLGDAGGAVSGILALLQARAHNGAHRNTLDELNKVRVQQQADYSPIEQQHIRALNILRAVLPADAIMMGDIAQLVYTGSPAMATDHPRTWFYPAGFGTLGCALPGAVGAKAAFPERAVVVLVGDGGFMFTLQELATAVEQEMTIPIILWNNDCLAMIRDGMVRREIPQIGVNQRNPDFMKLADAFGCPGIKIDGADQFETAITEALNRKGPTLIMLNEGDAWLTA